jgi:hypothetical protein
VKEEEEVDAGSAAAAAPFPSSAPAPAPSSAAFQWVTKALWRHTRVSRGPDDGRLSLESISRICLSFIML